jgi:hypothetical protein
MPVPGDEKIPVDLHLTRSHSDIASIHPRSSDIEVLHAILDVLKERLPGHGLLPVPTANMPLATPDSASTAVQIIPVGSNPLPLRENSMPSNLNVLSTVSNYTSKPTDEDDVGVTASADGLDPYVQARYNPKRMPSL